jgi:hypothetical protein
MVYSSQSYYISDENFTYLISAAYKPTLNASIFLPPIQPALNQLVNAGLPTAGKADTSLAVIKPEDVRHYELY